MLLLKKRLNSVHAKVSFLSTGILNDKSAFSAIINIFKNKTIEQLVG